MPFQLTRRALTCALVLTPLAALVAAPVQAKSDYPERPVRIIVGFPAGGTTDVIARIMAKELSDRLKQSFIVENRPGAGSNIGAEAAARATPDGYTLYFVAVTSAINQTLYPNLNFDLRKDFVPVGFGAWAWGSRIDEF